MANANPAQGILSEQKLSELISARRSTDPASRCEATMELGEVGHAATRAIPALQALLSDPCESVRLNATFALGYISRDIESVRLLLNVLGSDPSDGVRHAAAAALGAAGVVVPEVVAALLVAAYDQCERVRVNAILSLGDLRSTSEGALDTLVLLLDDKDAAVRGAAAEAVAGYGQSAFVFLPRLADMLDDEDRNVVGSAMQALAILGEATIPEMARILRDSYGESMLYAVQLLKRLAAKSRRASAALAKGLEIKIDYVRTEIVRVLIELGSSVIAAVLPLLSSKHSRTRKSALEVLQALAEQTDDQQKDAIRRALVFQAMRETREELRTGYGDLSSRLQFSVVLGWAA